ncbi:MAG TPA: hypothetical protein VGN01_13410 [Acidobacteriaceae bacterium]|jgi:hypothetical protein
MNRPNPVFFALYRGSLHLYPPRLRMLYQDQMLQTVRDADVERSSGVMSFWFRLFIDLIQSSVKERLLMIREPIFARPVFFYTLALALILTLWGFPAAMTLQGVMRSAADQPQIQMAQNYASEIASGHRTVEQFPDGHVDLATSLEPFTILYDSNGKALHSNGYFNGEILAPPTGVFTWLRTHPTDKFTWQPRPGLRIAAVAQRIDGAHPGVVLVGRSLTLVQQQESLLRRGTFVTWLSLMAILIGGAAFLNRAQGAAGKPATAHGHA